MQYPLTRLGIDLQRLGLLGFLLAGLASFLSHPLAVVILGLDYLMWLASFTLMLAEARNWPERILMMACLGCQLLCLREPAWLLGMVFLYAFSFFRLLDLSRRPSRSGCLFWVPILLVAAALDYAKPVDKEAPVLFFLALVLTFFAGWSGALGAIADGLRAPETRDETELEAG